MNFENLENVSILATFWLYFGPYPQNSTTPRFSRKHGMMMKLNICRWIIVLKTPRSQGVVPLDTTPGQKMWYSSTVKWTQGIENLVITWILFFRICPWKEHVTNDRRLAPSMDFQGCQRGLGWKYDATVRFETQGDLNEAFIEGVCAQKICAKIYLKKVAVATYISFLQPFDLTSSHRWAAFVNWEVFCLL